MKIKSILLLCFALVVGVLLCSDRIMSHSNTPPTGYTGSPFDNGDCTSCHNPGATCSPTIVVTDTLGNSISQIVADSVYELNFSLATPTRGGFQCTTDDGSGNFLGNFIIRNATTEQITVVSGNGRQYMEHLNAAPAVVSWTFRWVAPSNPTASQVTFYFGYVCGTSTSSGSGTSNCTGGSTSISFNLCNPAYFINTPQTISVTPSFICNHTQNVTATATPGGFPNESMQISGSAAQSGYVATASSLAPSSYTATYSWTDCSGNAQSVNTSFTVVNCDFAAKFGVSNSTVCQGDSALFSDSTVLFGSGNPPYTYSWDFGDGSAYSNAMNPKHAYASAGSFTAKEIVTDMDGYMDSTTKIITVTLCNILTAHAGSDQTICSGDSITLGGTPAGTGGSGHFGYHWSPSTGLNNDTIANPIAKPTSSQTYILVLYDSINVISDTDTVAVTVHQPTFSTQSQTICSNNTYTLNGKVFSSAGIYNDTLMNHAGCDSIITLTLNVKNISSTLINQTSCSNVPYVFNGHGLTTSGTYYDTLTNYLGCDSLLVLTLNVNNPSGSSFSATTCGNVPYVFNGHGLTIGGTYYDTLTNYVNCDSIITLLLTVNPAPITNITHNICSGQSYTFKGQSLSVGGVYYDTLQTVLSCDSIIILNLNVYAPTTSVLNHNICTNTSYNFNGTILTTAGTYYDTIPNYGGCDSAITLHLVVLNTSSSAFNQTICSNQPYSFNGHQLNTPGTYYDTLPNYVGCDSFITLHLTVLPVSNYSYSQITCHGNPVLFNGKLRDSTGTYYDTLTNYLGCDSLVALHLSSIYPSNHISHVFICTGNTYSFYGKTLSTAGVYVDTLTGYLGCDSFITIHLSIHSPNSYSYNQTICSNQSYLFNGYQLVTPGTYYDTLTNHAGCDSFITMNLSVLPISSYSYNKTICVNQPYLFHGHYLNTPGTYYDTLPNYVGCDSFITLNLTVKPISSYTYSQTICRNNPLYFANHFIDTTGTYYDTLTNYVGCDSLITLNLLSLYPSNHISHINICTGQTYLFYGHILSNPGVYVDTLTGYLGCDSFITLHLGVLNNTSSINNQTICGGQTYTFGGHILNTPGTYYDTLLNQLGCDSIVTLNLMAGSNTFSNINQSICAGGSYTFHGQTLTVSGTYYDTLINSNGCNTLVTLHLLVLNNTSSTQTQNICNGHSYNFYGQQLFAGGTYTHHLLNHFGCDSSIILTLNVTTPNIAVTQHDSILTSQATGSTYQWVTCHGSNQNVYAPIVGATNSVYVADSTGWYAVIVTTGSCSDTSVCYFVNKNLHTGIATLTNSTIKVFPNPTDNVLNIQWQSEEHLQKIILEDAIGRIVKELIPTGNNETLNIKDLPNGIYFLHLFAKTERVMKVLKD